MEITWNTYPFNHIVCLLTLAGIWKSSWWGILQELKHCCLVCPNHKQRFGNWLNHYLQSLKDSKAGPRGDRTQGREKELGLAWAMSWDHWSIKEQTRTFEFMEVWIPCRRWRGTQRRHHVVDKPSLCFHLVPKLCAGHGHTWGVGHGPTLEKLGIYQGRWMQRVLWWWNLQLLFGGHKKCGLPHWRGPLVHPFAAGLWEERGFRSWLLSDVKKSGKGMCHGTRLCSGCSPENSSAWRQLWVWKALVLYSGFVVFY
jgi:hypothetical protein